MARVVLLALCLHEIEVEHQGINPDVALMDASATCLKLCGCIYSVRSYLSVELVDELEEVVVFILGFQHNRNEVVQGS